MEMIIKKRKINVIEKILICVIMLILSFSNLKAYANLEDKEEIDINLITTETIQTVSKIRNEPQLNSRIALVYDRVSGKIIYQKNGEKQTPMASTTKIMTAIVVVENCNLEEVVTIQTKAAVTGGSRLGLKKNDKITVNDLLYGLMLRSGNDAAVALAQYISGTVEEFANLMNEKAKSLGLVNTQFKVPHGLDVDGHYTTAYELAKITDYALKIQKIKDIVVTKNYIVTINGKGRTISNTNELLGYLNGVYGVKTGFTNGAGRCLVTACKRDSMDIITVIIGANTKKDRTTDSIKLIEYTFKNYKMIEIKDKISEEFNKWKKINQKRIKINKGTKNEIELELEELLYEKIAVKNAMIDNVEIEINAIFYLDAPIIKDTIIGNLKFKIAGKVIDVLNIYCKEEIKKKQINDYLLEFLKIYSR